MAAPFSQRPGFNALLAWYFVSVWGTGFIASKIGLQHAAPFTFLTLRFAFGIACLAVIVALAGVTAITLYQRAFCPLVDLLAAAWRSRHGVRRGRRDGPFARGHKKQRPVATAAAPADDRECEWSRATSGAC